MQNLAHILKKIKNATNSALDRFCRVFLASFGFGIFGIICGCGNLIFVPLILLKLHRYKKVQYFSRDLVRYAWRLFLWILRFSKRVQYRFAISSHLHSSKNPNQHFTKSKILDNVGNPSEIIIANHPSLLDVVLLIAHIPRINCVIKASLAKNIFLFGAIKASGYILNTANEEILSQSIDALKMGESLLIFPEGTRTKDKIILHKAASYIAIHSAKNLSAIFIKMSPKSLQKDSKWYNTTTQTLRYELSLEAQITLDEFEKERVDSIRVRHLHEILSNLYHSLNH